MKTLYIECKMGAAGDMLSGALLDLLPEEERRSFIDSFNNMGLPGVLMSASPSEKCGVIGTHVTVTVDGVEEGEHVHAHADDGSAHAHVHRGMKDIDAVVNGCEGLPEAVKKEVLEVYKIIAEAESKVHGTDVTEIHFHEVGMMDAIADVTAVCMLMDRISPDRITASAVNTGSGHVHCAHGVLPVPAPATKLLLEGIPYYSNGIESELCTPTGAALLKHFAAEFGEKPAMNVTAEGCGMGKKDFEEANCVRVYLGE